MTQFKELPCNKMSLAKRKLVHGVGINDANYQTTPIVNGKQRVCPYYSTWRNMLERCYDSKYQNKQPTYVGCSVCSEWHTFTNFKAWMVKQEWKGNQIDKDLLFRGNKIYSPSTCLFVTQEINKLLNDCGATRGNYAIGVCWHEGAKKYVARCNADGKTKHLGLFLTEDEASQVYRACKRELIIVVANRQTDMRLKNALLLIANTEYN